MMQITPMVRNLLLINILLFMGQMLLQLDFPSLGGLRNFLSADFAPYQAFTHLFIHSNFGHLLSNMLGLYVFGTLIEYVWGSKKFLAMYIISGIGASLLYSLVQAWELQTLLDAVNAYSNSPNSETFAAFLMNYSPLNYSNNLEFINAFAKEPNSTHYIAQSTDFIRNIYNSQLNGILVGASGCVFGVTMVFALLFPNKELMLLFPPMPIKAKYLAVLYIGYEVFDIIRMRPDDNVAHFAHLGGALFGYIFYRIWKR